MRYEKLGFIRKKRGLQMWDFHFDYSLLRDGDTEVYVVKRPKRHAIRSQKEVKPGTT